MLTPKPCAVSNDCVAPLRPALASIAGARRWLALRRGDIIAASPGKLRLISLDEVHSLSRVFSSRRDVDWPILCSVRRSDVHRRSQKDTVRVNP